jgi:hypothetical protein
MQSWENEGLLISATDGSAPEDGTFGWVLALPDGTALVKCNGPAGGAPDHMSSGRAETVGVLSLAHFFHAAMAYLETIPTGHCRNYIDSTAKTISTVQSTSATTTFTDILGRGPHHCFPTPGTANIQLHINTVGQGTPGSIPRIQQNVNSRQDVHARGRTRWVKSIENATKARTERQHSPNHAWSPFQVNVYNSSSTAMQYHSHPPNGCATRSQDMICYSTFRIDMIGMIQHGTSSTGMGSERPSDLGLQQ